MKAIKQKILGVFALLFFVVNVIAQPSPPGGGGGGGTNYLPTISYYAPPTYVLGLQVTPPTWSGTNLYLNLQQADPAGSYGIYFASNLLSSWSGVSQGTNGQTNFTLTSPQTDMGFFRAARTDTPITDAANVIFSFTNLFVNTNVFTASVVGGPAAAMTGLVNDTNFADAIWIPFSSVPVVLLGTNDGAYDVWFGFQGSDGAVYWSDAIVTLDTTPPSIVITNPVVSTVSKPMIQLQGYSPEPLSHLTFDVSNAVGVVSNQQGFVTDQFYDTNTWRFTTNSFQCFDISLTNGLNQITLHATDLAGNVTTTNFNFTLDYSDVTNPPVVQIAWPQNGYQISASNFTCRGCVSDPTATVSTSITDTNGDTNTVQGLVERNGNFWVENLPLNAGTNTLTLTVTDATGNMSVTNISVIQSSLVFAMTPVTGDQLWQPTVSVSGTISDASYAVWVNGVKGHNNGDGTWSATNVPVNKGGTASFDFTAYAPDEQQPDGSFGN